MQNITRLQAEIAQQKAEIESYVQSMRALQDYMHSQKFAEHPYVNVTDIVLWARQALDAGSYASEAAWVNEVGPKPVASPRGWACPDCRAPLQDHEIWNDTDARAAERMRLHWREMHRS